MWCNSVASCPLVYCWLQRTEFLCHTCLLDLQGMEKSVWIGFLTLNQLLTTNTQIRRKEMFFLCPPRWSSSQKSTWHCTKFWWQFLSWWLEPFQWHEFLTPREQIQTVCMFCFNEVLYLTAGSVLVLFIIYGFKLTLEQYFKNLNLNKTNWLWKCDRNNNLY